MRRRKNVNKEVRAVRRHIHELNKQLREDCFAGRFELKRHGMYFLVEANFGGRPYCPQTIDEWAEPNWLQAIYEVELCDNEQPERNVRFYFKYSEHTGLRDGHPVCNMLEDTEGFSKAEQYNNNGHLVWIMNEFIIKSDFWEKWKSLGYARTHWFSGKELEEHLLWDPMWVSPDEVNKKRPGRFVDD